MLPEGICGLYDLADSEGIWPTKIHFSDLLRQRTAPRYIYKMCVKHIITCFVVLMMYFTKR